MDNPKLQALGLLATKGWEDFKESVKPYIEPLKKGLDDIEAKGLEAEEDLVKGNVELLNRARDAQQKPRLNEDEVEQQRKLTSLMQDAAMSVGSIKNFKGKKLPKFKNFELTPEPTVVDVEASRVLSPDDIKELKRGEAVNASDEVHLGIEEAATRDPSKLPPKSDYKYLEEAIPEGTPSWSQGAPVAEYTKGYEDVIASRPQYHGTGANINKYKQISPHDPVKSGNSTRSKAVFFSEDPGVASEFAQARGEGSKWNPKVYGNVVAPESTFNPKDPEKLKKLKEALFKKGMNSSDPLITNLDKELGSTKNTWQIMESPTIQDAIEDAGFDSFVVYENGKKNLGVFNPDVAKPALTKMQRKEALESIKQQKLNQWIDKILKSDKEAYDLMSKDK